MQFALQSTDDPSLLLPAADIWAGGTADGWAAAGLSYPEDDLLAGLGRASRLFPELDAALQTAAPASVALDTRGALHFLKETGPLLAGAGFGVLLPDWVRRSRLGLKLTTRSRTAAGLGLGHRAGSSAWPTSSTSGTSWPSGTRPWIRPSSPSWRGSRCRWSGFAASGSSWTSGISRRRCSSWSAAVPA